MSCVLSHTLSLIVCAAYMLKGLAQLYICHYTIHDIYHKLTLAATHNCYSMPKFSWRKLLRVVLKPRTRIKIICESFLPQKFHASIEGTH